MRLLVLGGSHFVGRALVEAALSAGHDVATLNRGLTGRVSDAAELLRALPSMPRCRRSAGAACGPLRVRVESLGVLVAHHEDIGRLRWWLQRLDRGGQVIAPGPPSRPLQYIDARDLAAWMLHCAETQVGGIFNTVSPVGHTTMGELLDAALHTTKSTAELVWLTPEQIAEAGIAPWSELPIWVPPDGPLAGLHDCDVTAAIEAGLHCRPTIETVTDTWSWLQAEGPPEQRDDRPTHGIDPHREATIIQQNTERQAIVRSSRPRPECAPEIGMTVARSTRSEFTSTAVATR